MVTDAIPIPAPVVLLVEDEVLVRMVAADILFEAGFHVIEAVNAVEAQLVLKARDDVEAIVTDINMPGGLSGLELAAVVSGRDPRIAIVVTSGRERPLAGELPDGAVFEGKPYTPDSLASALRRALEARNPTSLRTVPEGVSPAQPAAGATDQPIVLPGKLAS